MEKIKIMKRKYLDKSYEFIFKDGIIKKDYYKDQLVQCLPELMSELLSDKSSIRVLDMATGHGYTLVILSDYYAKYVEQIVAYDINPGAVELARLNADRNGCPKHKIDFRIGSLYDPLSDNEKFDLIISALPPVPVRPEELEKMPEDVRVHHWVDSTAGETGRDLLDGMLENASKHLNKNGVVVTAQADFQNATKHTLEIMKKSGMMGSRIGEARGVKVKDTKLTLNRRDHIRALGYQFTLDEEGNEQFFVEVYKGTYL